MSGPNTAAAALSHSTTAGGAELALGVEPQAGPSTLEATVTAGGKEFSVEVAVGPDPTVAWNILGSMAPTASTAETPSSCVPGGEVPVPMPTLSTLEQPLTPAGGELLLDPPPPGAEPATSAAQAWESAGVKGLAGGTYLLFLAQYSYPAQNGIVLADAGANHVLAWVIYGQNEKTQQPGCTPSDSLTEIDATTGDSLWGSIFAHSELPQGAVVTPAH